MGEQRNLTGERFGNWLVLGPSEAAVSRQKRWLCRCGCGTQRDVLERSLIYGESKSCGCVCRERARKAASHEISGQVFGDLTALHKAREQRVNGGIRWTCRCSCGNECDVPATLLVNGRKTHCGCKTEKEYHSVDIAGRQFNRLTALYPTGERTKNGSVIWHCRCACGNGVDVSYNTLSYSPMQSCGCRKREHDAILQTLLTRVDGTSLDMIRSRKIPAHNTTGTRGVYFVKGKWVAKIVFQKKQYHLGKYDTPAEAARVRREAEELLFDGAAAHYARWKEKADADPEWAKNNPVKILVQKTSASGLDVVFLPVIA